MCGSGKFLEPGYEVSGTFSGTQLMLVTLAVLGTATLERQLMSSSERPQSRQVLSARQARQGVTGHHVRLVLALSVAAIVIVFAIIWIVYFG